MVLVLILFLLGCKPVEEQIAAETVTEENATDLVNETEGPCSPAWRCVGKWYKAYQYSNCSWSEKTKCPLSCINDTCKEGETCETGFKCVDENKKGFQTEACIWIEVRDCEYGCEDSKCSSAPRNDTNATTAPTAPVETEEETTTTTQYTNPNLLYLGETETISVGGEEYNISIYNIESGRVMLKINSYRSDWGYEDEELNASGITFFFKEILFQPYASGTKAVGYTATSTG